MIRALSPSQLCSRRGFTPESIQMFVELAGVSKANSSVDYAMLEYCIREDLKLKKASSDGGPGSGEAGD